MTTIHVARPGDRYLLCGDELATETVSARPQDITCPACRDIIDEWNRGTVARSMNRRQILQAEAAAGLDLLALMGYPLPGEPPPGPGDCEHRAFGASVDVNRLTDTDAGPVTGYAADIRIACLECGLPFRFTGLPAGLLPGQPTTSLAGDELRAPIKPMPPDIAAALARS